MSVDKNSDISCEYLELDSSEDDYEFIATNIDQKKEISHNNIKYIIIPNNKMPDKYNTDVIAGKCEICNIMFKTIGETEEHLSMHESKACKKCEICDNIVDVKMFVKHIENHKDDYRKRTLKNRVECRICGKFLTKTYLNFHIKMHGTSEQKSERMKQCSVCDKVVSYYYYKAHMERVHQEQSIVTNKSDFIATVKRTKCPICDHTINESSYKKHLAGHGCSKKPYVCDQCGKVFLNYSSFQTHCLTHRNDFKYKCQFCPYRGRHLGLLKVHVRTHTMDYLYECTTCNKRFLTKSNLSIHEKKHKTPEYHCIECDKGFYSQRNLNKHVNLMHLRIRNVICEICGKAFGHRDGLLAHERNVHKRKSVTYKGRAPSYLKVVQD